MTHEVDLWSSCSTYKTYLYFINRNNMFISKETELILIWLPVFFLRLHCILSHPPKNVYNKHFNCNLIDNIFEMWIHITLFFLFFCFCFAIYFFIRIEDSFVYVYDLSSTNRSRTVRHDIAEILLKVALNIITLTPMYVSD